MNKDYQRVVDACRELNSIPNGIGTGKLWWYLLKQSYFYLIITIRLRWRRFYYK